MQQAIRTKFDTVIVGAGSAGCVLAARLSEDRNRSVLLLDAGPDYRTEAELPVEIRNGFNPAYSHDWGYASEPGALGRAVGQSRGKLVGGCSATNGTFALRGTPADFDEWVARGNEGWSFEDILPAFRQLEHDLDFNGKWHGQEGPLPIRRYAPDELVPEQDAFLRACTALGYAEVADHNVPGAVGAGRMPVNTLGGVRQSTALTYLAAARDRPNLAIRGDAMIDRVLFEGRRAIGIRLAQDSETILARHVVLAAGAFGSPAALMRSGIGPAEHLAALGIDVFLDRPGVGRRLSDHARLGLRYAVPAAASQERPGCQTVLTLKSSPDVAGYDLHIFPWTIATANPAAPAPPGMTIHAALMKPKSLGFVRLRSPDPAAAPVIDPAYLTHPDDMPRMIHAVRVARQIARMAPLSAMLQHGLSAAAQAGNGASDLEAAIRAEVGTYFHPVGTCAMGPASDAMAVVDAHAGVHGAPGLSVADASVMPTITAANTNLTTIMIAERCAGWFRRDGAN